MERSSGTRTSARCRTRPRRTCWTGISTCWWRQAIHCTRLRCTEPRPPASGRTAHMLQVSSVSKSFWGIRALDRVDLSVAAGTVHAVTGENGAGKSTLMRIIAGLEHPDSGEVRFSGRAIAMIHQELLAFPALSVAENLFLGQEPGRFGWIDKAARDRETRRLLRQLGLDIDPARPMRELSVAEQQSVEIAKALRREADLIIMDEPTSALSDRESELLFERIAGLKRGGAAILYISHRMPEIFRLADTITVMRDGRHVATAPAGEFDESRLIALMVGRTLDHSIARTAAPV